MVTNEGDKALEEVDADDEVETRDPTVLLQMVARLKKKWGDGPWQHEPDEIAWTCGGYLCFMRRNLMGVWCGYVAVPPGHPCHGVEIGNPPLNRVRAHGSLTWTQLVSAYGTGLEEWFGTWWLIGFDCGHLYSDIVPSMQTLLRGVGASLLRDDLEQRAEYRDVAYVAAVVEIVAVQLAKLEAELPARS